MLDSKAWDWSKVETEKWLQPSEESYYFLHQWQNKQFTKLLDLGCGLGRHSTLFARNGFQVEAFDLSQEGLDYLNESIQNTGLPIHTTFGDMKHLPYEDHRFDCIMAFHVIYHTDTLGLKQILKEIHRVLKPGGEFLITFVSKLRISNPDREKWIDENTLLRDEGGKLGIPHYYVDFECIKELMQDFELQKIRHIEDITLDTDKRSWHYFVSGRR